LRVQDALTLDPSPEQHQPGGRLTASPPTTSLQQPRVTNQRGVQHQQPDLTGPLYPSADPYTPLKREAPANPAPTFAPSLTAYQWHGEWNYTIALSNAAVKP
jgi:hypothetical protein